MRAAAPARPAANQPGVRPTDRPVGRSVRPSVRASRTVRNDLFMVYRERALASTHNMRAAAPPRLPEPTSRTSGGAPAPGARWRAAHAAGASVGGN